MKALSLTVLLFLIAACNSNSPQSVVQTGGADTTETIVVPDVRCSSAPSGSFHAGAGTSGDPFLICTPAEWNTLSTYCAANTDCDGLHFKIGDKLTFSNLDTSADLSLLSVSDNNISPLVHFKGSIDGGSHEISGIILFGDGTNPVGLIDYYDGESGSLKNFKISNSYFNGGANGNVGSLLGAVDYTSCDDLLVDQVSVSKNVIKSNGGYIGGVIGFAYAANEMSIKNASADVVTQGGSYAGGLVGFINGSIENATAKGSVSGATNYSGGLVGFVLSGSSIKKAKSLTTVTAASGPAGGMFGQTLGGTIEEVEVKAIVVGPGLVGGLIGANHGPLTLSSAKLDTNLTSSAGYMGGVLGESSNVVSISQVSATTVGNGATYAGGLMAYNTSSLTMTESTIKGTITSAGRAGGLVGSNTSSLTMNDVTVDVDLFGGDRTGGLVGENNSSFTGNGLDVKSIVNLRGATAAGGLFGYSTSTASIHDLNLVTSIVQDSSSPTSFSYIGGISGQNHGNFSLNSGNISILMNLQAGATLNYVGGYMGFNTSSNLMTGFVFTSKGVTSGPATCAAVSSYFGGQVGSASHFGNVINLDFSGFHCL